MTALHPSLRASHLVHLRALAIHGLRLEHAVLAPYLCAFWSIHEGASPEARSILRSVAMEEMLHMCVAANLALALGGEPTLGGISLPIGPFDRARIAWFEALEAPGRQDGIVPSDHRPEDVYGALRAALIPAVASFGEEAVFVGDPARQLPASMYWGGRGALAPVTDLASALVAIDLLLDQTSGRGGADPGSPGEAPADSHYRRFRSLLQGRAFAPGDTDRATGEPLATDWAAVWRFEATWSADPEIRREQEAFRATWDGLTRDLQGVLRGAHDRFPALARTMCTLGPAAVRLMRLPGSTPGVGAGPVL